MPRSMSGPVIRFYSDFRVLLLTGSDVAPKRLYVVPVDSILAAEGFDLSKSDGVVSFRPVRSSAYPDLLLLRSLSRSTGEWSQKLFSRGNRSDIPASALTDEVLEPELAGMGRGSSSDIVSARLQSDGRFKPSGNGVELVDVPPVPDSIVTIKSARGWALMAIEGDYVAARAAPNRHGYETTEYLILDRSTGEWSSFLVPGSSTELAIVNNWLAGTVADVHPDTDFERGFGSGPVLSPDVAFPNPLTGVQFSVTLGKFGQVLWIDGDVVYYRVLTELYKARIVGRVFVDRQLLLADSPEGLIVAAFRGFE